MKNANQLKEIINHRYPISEESMVVLENSVNSFLNQSNTLVNYESQNFFLLVPFLAKLLHELESNGCEIHSLKSPTDLLPKEIQTIRFKSFYGEFLDSPTENVDFEIMHLMIDEIVQKLKGKKISLYTILPETDKKTFHVNVYIRGVI